MEFSVPYGKKDIVFFVPDRNAIPLIHDKSLINQNISEEDIIRRALENPSGSGKLSDIAYSKENACILVSDITRPCPSYRFLPQIVDQLKNAKVRKINIVFGLGIHRCHTEDEKLKLAGEYTAQYCSLTDSDGKRCRLIGTTSFGTPVEVFEKAAESDFLIATGNIEYHYFAGYSAGAKALMPGVCSRKTVSANHSMMLEEEAAAGIFHNNPVRQDIEEAGKIAGIDFLFNVIIDDSKKITGAVAGKNNQAFLEGVKLYDSIYEIKAGRQADIVITSPGGYPKDINLYQAQKALENVRQIIKKGGTIVLVAQCPEGFGEAVFEEWMADVRNYDKLHSRIKKEFVLGGHKAVAISGLLNNVKIYLYRGSSGCIGPEQSLTGERGKLKKTYDFGFEPLDNIQSFIDSEIKKNKDLKIAVVPNGRFIRL